ncbi:YqaJ viral recombinase family nuclease [Kitasatospora sp. NPDC001175]|uniref:YqaJ viral recombinase family nuclease n=1 Tax=Kitasatospora sp. NPDC001175 TaxID=3157103 RepID=UPI003D095747
MTVTELPGTTESPAAGRRVTPTARLVLPADADRNRWLDARRAGIGSSDVPAILGVNDYATPLHVYLDKLGELSDDAGEAAHWGNVLEEPVAREWARRNRSVVRRVGLVAHQDESWRRATLDRRITECPLPESRREACALEVKTRSAFKSAQWHSGAPDDVLAQVLWQMAVTGYDHMHYAVLIGGNDYRQGVVRADQHRQTTADVLTAVAIFWTGNVLARVRPPHSGTPARNVELYRRLHTERVGVVHLDHQPDAHNALLDYETARLEEAAARKRKEVAQAELLRLLGDAQVAALGNGKAWSMEPTVGRPSTDYGRLAERWPDAYADCVTTKPGERLDIDKAFRLKPQKES